MRFSAALFALFAVSAPFVSARAEPPNDSPFAVHWPVDVPLTAASFVVFATSTALTSEIGPSSCGLACNASTLNALDRTVVGNHSTAARQVSDVLVGVNLALPAVLDFVDVSVTGPRDARTYRGWGEDMMILSEVAAINFALNNVVKLAVRRPRPLAYDPAVDAKDRLDPDASLSFYSEHASTSFAMATAYSYLFGRRHPHSPLVVPVWIVTEGLAATTAALRLAAGKHFWTDVIAGASVGSAMGLVVPVLHRKAVVGASTAAIFGAGVRVLPVTYPGGGGLAIVMGS